MAQLLTHECPNDDAVRWIIERMNQAGLRVVISFDMRNTGLVPDDCPCQHHDSTACDCQMVVLLVYGAAPNPATLVVHSSDGRTWLSLSDFPGQRPSPLLRTAILTAFTPDTPTFHHQ